jgi:hypothetical protein
MALSTSDPYYRAEITPPALDALARALRAFWPGAEIGTRGNQVHLRGYHRSRAWVLHSPDCTSRTYSVTETPGNRSGGDDNAICALDVGLPARDLLPLCGRLDAAVRAGRLEKVTEWYGNLGGDDRVDGYDNIRNRLASSDPSHLVHAHLSFDRGRVDEDHSDVLAILTGEGFLMALTDKQQADLLYTLTQIPMPDGTRAPLHVAIGAMFKQVALVAKTADIDPAELAAITAAAKTGAAQAITAADWAEIIPDAEAAEVVRLLGEREAAAARAAADVLDGPES